MGVIYESIRPLLFRLGAEQAHTLTIRLLKTGMIPAPAPFDDPALKVTLWNRTFPNPVGLAAGFDKNAEVIAPMLRLGFGFAEAGTVTPRPQHGNPRPRVFRDPENEAVINRMGFPNCGLNRFRENLERFLSRKPRPAGVVGLNIGMNKSQTDPASDYCLLVQQLAPLADYLTVNISSPNTPGLRDMQKPENLAPFLDRLMDERARACQIDPPPLLLKLAPDLDLRQQEDIAKTVLASGIDGMILTNTTLERPARLPAAFAGEKGGLSGAPLRDKSTSVIRNFYRLTAGRLPIVGAGGISTAHDAYDKIRAGASLVQLYTALVFKGPSVVRDINSNLVGFLKRDGFSHVSQAVGTGQAEDAETIRPLAGHA